MYSFSLLASSIDSIVSLYDTQSVIQVGLINCDTALQLLDVQLLVAS